jgi:hypothetical protein
LECGRNDQFKPETEFIAGATNDGGNDLLKIFKTILLFLYSSII